jgi:1-deoxy-D-xylulose-5-phosphate reductoisomerase
MKKNVIILGSTGSIGKSTIKVLSKDKKNFKIRLLSTNRNSNTLINQAITFKVKNLIISDKIEFNKAKIKYKNLRINFFNDFEIINKLFRKKEIDYSMVSIVGLDGLRPSLLLPKYSKSLAIVNKESLLSGWSLINSELTKYKTKFIPIDSEHFSISSLLNSPAQKNSIEKVFITASGGPFLNYSKKMLRKVTIKDALKHPNWRMGNKITIDSSTLMNKVFEVIEAKNIFNLSYNQISVLIHQNSYAHALLKFKNGPIKLLLHEPDMKIPIQNSIYDLDSKKLKTKEINFKILNNLRFKFVNEKQFPLIKILKILPNRCSLYETVLLSINDFFVEKFLNKKITYIELVNLIKKYALSKHFLSFRNKRIKSMSQIYKIREYVYLKLNNLSI